MFAVGTNRPGRDLTRQARSNFNLSTRDGENSGSLLPATGKAALFFSFGSGFTDCTVAIKPALEAIGYTVINRTTGTLEDYKSLSDVSLLYVDSHGMKYTRKGSKTVEVSVMSATKVTEELDKANEDDLKSGDLHYYGEPKKDSPDYCFTGPWAKRNIKLASDAVVFLNSCNGQHTDSMSKALAENGMRAMLGWTEPVSDGDAAGSAYFFFDESIGKQSLLNYPAGVPKPTEPSLWTDTVSKMKLHKRGNPDQLTFAQSHDGCLLKTSGTTNWLGPIRPKIKEIAAQELDDRVFLGGVFGSTTGTVQGKTASGATINVPVIRWSLNSVTVAYDSTIISYQVTVNNVKSNVFDYEYKTYRLGSQSMGAFTLKDSITVWLSGKQVFAGSGSSVGPISFQGRNGAAMRIQIKSSTASGGCGGIFVDSPVTANYAIIPGGLDIIAKAQGVVWDQTSILQK